MSKYLKETCGMAKRIREAESILREKNISISICQGGLEITVNCGTSKEFSCVMKDESNSAVLTFPAEFEPTYLHYEE